MDKVVLKREVEAFGISYSPDEIIKSIQEKYSDEIASDEIEQIITELKLEKRTFIGLLLMAIGAFIGFISMLLTVLEVFPEWRNFNMYGLTSLAIFIVVAGCYMVFEKE